VVDGTPSQVSDAERGPGADPGDGDDAVEDDDGPELAHHQASEADEQVRLVEDYLERRRLMPRLRAKG
jgi:hypothetical protein